MNEQVEVKGWDKVISISGVMMIQPSKSTHIEKQVGIVPMSHKTAKLCENDSYV